MKRLLVWVLALMLMVSCVPVSNANAANLSALESEFVDLINQNRSACKVEQLETDQTLTDAAQIRAPELAVRFDHTRPNGTKYYSIHEKIEAECYYYESGMDVSGSPQRAATWLMNSRAHREILMDSRVKSIGVGIYQSGNKTYYDVLLSTSPASQSVQRGGGSPVGISAPGFSDVKSSDYFASAVQWAVSKGITSGVTDSRFAPNDACTRAQIVTFLWRAAGSPRPSLFARSRFADVKSSDYFCSAVIWAQSKGIASGVTSTSFAPNQACTRAEAVAFLWRYQGSPSVTVTNKFSDVPSGAWFAKPVSWAVANGITTGVSATRFGPGETCTRAQIVTFLYRAIG